MSRLPLSVLCCAAAGPRLGFGHLVRCLVLTRAMGASPVIALRGTRAARKTARDMGAVVLPPAREAVTRVMPDVAIVDDPSTSWAGRWVRAARAAGVPSVSVGDLGRYCPDADLTVDGSLARIPGRPRADLDGPRFAVIDLPTGLRPRPRRRRVVITLGGGRHVRVAGAALAARLAEMVPDVEIDLPAGFIGGGSLPQLPGRCRWIASADLASALARASVAIVAGGVTLYEACSLGTPVVAMAVTPAQRVTTKAFADAGAVLDVSTTPWLDAIDAAAQAAAVLLADPDLAARFGRTARRIVDGNGARRVAERIHTIVNARRKGRRDAA